MWGVTALLTGSVYGGNGIVSRRSGGSTQRFRTLLISLLLIVNHVSAQNEDIESQYPQYNGEGQIVGNYYVPRGVESVTGTLRLSLILQISNRKLFVGILGDTDLLCIDAMAPTFLLTLTCNTCNVKC